MSQSFHAMETSPSPTPRGSVSGAGSSYAMEKDYSSDEDEQPALQHADEQATAQKAAAEEEEDEFEREDDDGSQEEIELDADDDDEEAEGSALASDAAALASSNAEATKSDTANNASAPSVASTTAASTPSSASPASVAASLSASSAANSAPATAASAPSSSSSSSVASTSVAPAPSSSSSSDRMYKIAIKRLLSDFKQMENDPPEGVSGAPTDPSSPFVWRCAVFGPSDTPWEGGVFQLQMHFGKEYPQKPPHVRFISKMFHPNVFADGNLCLDIIQDRWSPVHSVSTILTSIQSLLSDPNCASPANPEAAQLFSSDSEADKKEYRKRVRQCVERSTESM